MYSFEEFKAEYQQEVLPTDDPNALKILESANFAALIEALKSMEYPAPVKIVANSASFQKLVLENPDAFITLFSRDSVSALIHKACQDKNLNLVKVLAEKIQLDVNKEQVPSPNGSCCVGSTQYFHDKKHLLELAIATGDQNLVDYVLTLYKTAEGGLNKESPIVASAVACAAAKNQLHLVNFFIGLGLNVDAVYKDTFDYTALEHAILANNKNMIFTLIDKGAKLGRLDKERVIGNGDLEVLKYMIAKGEDFSDAHRSYNNDYLEKALTSHNVEMAKFVINELHYKPIPDNCDNERLEYNRQKILKTVLRSGSIAMLQFIETDLKIPVEQMIKEELANTEVFHHMNGDFFMIEAVCAYQVSFLKYLYENRGLKPSKKQLWHLEGYAYDNGSGLPQHQKFVTHAYVYSLIHDDPEMAKVLLAVSNTSSLASVSSADLFRIFADYSKNFQESERRMQYNHFFRENSLHLAKEIAKRHLSFNDIQALTQSNPKLANDVFFYFFCLGQGYSENEIEHILESKDFNPNADYFAGNRALHLVIHFERSHLIPLLLKQGADPNATNGKKETALNKIGVRDENLLKEMLAHTQDVSDTLFQAMTEGNASLIVAIIKTNDGIPKVANPFEWIKTGRDYPVILEKVLRNLNLDLYANIKAQAMQANDLVLLEIIGFVDHFKQTNKRHTTLDQLEILEQLGNMPNRPLGGCCGGGLFAMFGIQSLLRKIEYPDFIKEKCPEPKDLTAEKVADAFKNLKVGPITFEVKKGIFHVWAQKSELSFGLKEVDALLNNNVAQAVVETPAP